MEKGAQNRGWEKTTTENRATKREDMSEIKVQKQKEKPPDKGNGIA
jgi:hypothetical protein